MTEHQLLLFQGVILVAVMLLAVPAFIWDWRSRHRK
jgi:hypothetical protein